MPIITPKVPGIGRSAKAPVLSRMCKQRLKWCTAYWNGWIMAFSARWKPWNSYWLPKRHSGPILKDLSFLQAISSFFGRRF